jgi:hypothetical protein
MIRSHIPVVHEQTKPKPPKKNTMENNNNSSSISSSSSTSSSSSWQSAVTALSHRVTISGVLGGMAGSALAVYRGHHQISRTAVLTGFSWALVATTLFGTERILHYGIRNAMLLLSNSTSNQDEKTTAPPRYVDYISYGLSGMLGGLFLGGAYIQRPWRGAIFFTPLMICVAEAEHQWEDHKHQKQMEYYYSSAEAEAANTHSNIATDSTTTTNDNNYEK